MNDAKPYLGQTTGTRDLGTNVYWFDIPLVSMWERCSRFFSEDGHAVSAIKQADLNGLPDIAFTFEGWNYLLAHRALLDEVMAHLGSRPIIVMRHVVDHAPVYAGRLSGAFRKRVGTRLAMAANTMPNNDLLCLTVDDGVLLYIQRAAFDAMLSHFQIESDKSAAEGR